MPAIITCTTDSIFEPGVEAGHVPALSSDTHVHLTCFTSGKPGMRREGLGDATLSENVAGCYQEWDRAFDPEGGPGTWRWPTRV